MPGEKLNFYNQLGERVKSYEIKNILPFLVKLLKLLPILEKWMEYQGRKLILTPIGGPRPSICSQTGKRNYPNKVVRS